MLQTIPQTALQSYCAWLTHREYSPATIQKYTKALARFFAESPAPAGSPPDAAPTREAVMAWRDRLAAGGYTPATVNALLAGVNMYQESIHNPGGKAKPLKRQRKIFADPGRELTRTEYFRLLTAARDAGKKRTLLLLQTLCATGIRVSELRFITVEAIQRHRAGIRCKGQVPGDFAAGRTVQAAAKVVQTAAHPFGGGVCQPPRRPAEPHHGLETVKGPVQRGQRGVEEGVPPQPAAPVCQDLLRAG